MRTLNKNWNYANVLDQIFNKEIGSILEGDFSFTNVLVNMYEQPESYQLEFAAPGLSKEDFKIEITKEVLTVKAEKKSEQTENAPKLIRKEFNFSNFKRHFTLPKNIDVDAIKANYENGVLYVTLPKKAVVTPEIKSIIIE